MKKILRIELRERDNLTNYIKRKGRKSKTRISLS
ncbi:hypothetical protein CDFC105_73199 [Clostridioides difficile]|nr:hypothetical protein CDFC105_61180 [Clostridioides difficile]CZS09699.1 hypothetical protein CDFC105_73199 [Clostridioides difficile]